MILFSNLWLILPFLAAPVGAEGIEVTALDGSSYTLEQTKITRQWQLLGLQDGKEVSVSAMDLVSVRFSAEKPPARPRGSQVIFPTGEVLVCKINSSDLENLSVQRPQEGILTVPLSVVAGIVFEGVSSSQVDSLRRQILRTGDETGDLLLLKNEDVITGTLLSIDDQQVLWDSEGKEVSISRSRVAGLAMDPDLIDYQAPKSFYGRLQLSDGSILGAASVTNQNGRYDRLDVTTTFGSTLSIPTTAKLEPSNLSENAYVSKNAYILKLTFHNGRVVYLSELQPNESVTRPFLDDRMPYRRDESVLGGPLSLGDEIYAKGLGVRSYSALVYEIDGFHRFEAIVGLDRSAGLEASVRFLVKVDDRIAFESGEMVAKSQPRKIDIPVEGARRLELIVDYAKRGDVQDYADWCNARLLRRK